MISPSLLRCSPQSQISAFVLLAGHPSDQYRHSLVFAQQMEGTLAKELYFESLQSTKSKLGDTLSSDHRQNWSSGSGVNDLCLDDGSLWGGSDEALDEISDLYREWQMRHDQFHTIGYRDGLIAGKEAAAQEGFNVGFKQSVFVGYKLGLVGGSGVDDLCQDDNGSLWGGSDEGLYEISDLDGEWQRRHDQFHMIGYRDSLIAGKEAVAQEGFNVGFKQSVFVGYKLGLVRGASSVFACLPADLKEKLMGNEENSRKLQSLYESMNSLSTADALRLLYSFT